MKQALVLALAFGVWIAPAGAATLWMQFEGGGNEVYMAPSQTLAIEIWVDLVAGDTLAGLFHTNWPYDGPDPSGIMDVPFDYPNGLENIVQVGTEVIPEGWRDQPVNGVLGVEGQQQVAFGAEQQEDCLSGPGSFLIGRQFIHMNSLIAIYPPFGQYDFYPIMFGGDPGGPTSTLQDLFGANFTFDPRYAGSYAGYYTWGQGAAAAAKGEAWSLADDPLIVRIPEPGALSLVLVGAFAILRRR